MMYMLEVYQIAEKNIQFEMMIRLNITLMSLLRIGNLLNLGKLMGNLKEIEAQVSKIFKYKILKNYNTEKQQENKE